MKRIVLAALLAAAACSKKPAPPDCDAEIAKGVASFVAAAKSGDTRPRRAEVLAEALKEALTERCKADKWSAEVVSCFSAASGITAMQTCDAKLPEDQRNRLRTEISEAIRSRGGMRGPRMPMDMPGHPSVLAGSNAGSATPPGQPGAGSAAPSPPGAAAGSGTPPAASGSSGAPGGSPAPATGNPPAPPAASPPPPTGSGAT